MSEKTILHLIDTTGPGGAETVFIQLADMLRGKGWRSIVVIQGPGWVQDELERRGIEPFVYPAKGSFAFGFLLYLLKLIKQEKVTVIQSHLLGSNVYASIAGLLSATPVVATYHGMVDIDPNERFRWLKHKAMQKGISRYIAVSNQLKHNILQRKLLDEEKTTVIYNGVDTKKYNKTDSEKIKTSLGIPENAILIGSLGNVRPAKNYETLIAAGKILLESNDNVHFIIAGDKKKSLMKKLETQMQESGVSENFHFIGFCQDCAEFLGQMNIFALSSSSEGFSIATIEALATGLPVVVTRCGGPEEIVTDKITGLLVPIEDPRALADAFGTLISDKVFSERLAQQGVAHTNATFGIDKMLQAYEDVYVQVSSQIPVSS